MNKAKKGALLTAGITSIACIGDTILYSVLPLYADSLQISDFWTGVLLSINRFVRLISHGVVALLIIRVGLKLVVAISSLLSFISTFSYQYPQCLSLFALARILWGVAYSGLRQSTLMYASHVSGRRKDAFAITQFIKSLGPFLILGLGHILFRRFGYQGSYLIISIVSIGAMLLTLYLPEIKIERNQFRFLKVIQFSNFKLLLFLVAFIADGLLVVILYLLFQDMNYNVSFLVFLVSMFLLLKKFISSFLPLLLLKTYSVFSISRHLFFAIGLMVAGLFLLSQYFIYVGLILCFMANTIIETIAPIEGIDRSKQNSKMEIVTSITFWWDMGKAFGALLGIKMYKEIGGELTWHILTLLLIKVALIYYGLNSHTANKK